MTLGIYCQTTFSILPFQFMFFFLSEQDDFEFETLKDLAQLSIHKWYREIIRQMWQNVKKCYIWESFNRLFHTLLATFLIKVNNKCARKTIAYIDMLWLKIYVQVLFMTKIAQNMKRANRIILCQSLQQLLKIIKWYVAKKANKGERTDYKIITILLNTKRGIYKENTFIKK